MMVTPHVTHTQLFFWATLFFLLPQYSLSAAPNTIVRVDDGVLLCALLLQRLQLVCHHQEALLVRFERLLLVQLLLVHQHQVGYDVCLVRCCHHSRHEVSATHADSIELLQ